nr:Aminoacyl-tRNA synthetase and Proteasome component region PCI domain containing protein [Haemonchus contortus]
MLASSRLCRVLKAPRSNLFRFHNLDKHLSTSSSSSSAIADYFMELKTRGLVRLCYPSNLESDFSAELKALPPVVYAGFDPTARSLHIGNLLIVVNLLRSAQFGARPIAIVGGATAAIGDPSGRAAERETQEKEQLMENSKSIIDQLKSISNNVLKEEITVVDNNDWFGNMPMVDYLRSCKQMRVGEMLRLRAVKARLEDSGISFTEFSYQTMQAYDWAVMLKKYDCRFQIGGSDQLGHLDLGAHYIKRTCGGKFAAGVCLPLVTDGAGNKLGKSVGGGDVWLSAELTSPFHFYQFLRQLHDTEAEQMYKQYSLAPWDDVLVKIEEHRANLGKWVVQDALATELTQIVHGDEGLRTAQRCSRALFQGSMEDVRSLNRAELMLLFGNTVKVVRSEVQTLGDLADRTRSDHIKGSILMTKGAFKINGEKAVDNTAPLVLERIVLPEAPDLTLICWVENRRKMADHKILPVFAFVDDREQLHQLREYLNNVGKAKLDPKGSPDVSENLIDICSQITVMGACPHPVEVDYILNSICSLMVLVPAEKALTVVKAFCNAITPAHFKGLGWNSNAGHAVHVLSNLYRAFAAHPKIQEVLFRSLVAMCSEARMIGELDCSTENLQKQFKQWGTAVDGQRDILRLVHIGLLEDQKADQAAKVMIMLLGTYTEKDAAQAREDAIECVRTAVVDPKSFSFDHLQRLCAVKALQKSDPLMYSALELFISGTLKDYRAFVKAHPEFVGDKLKVEEAVLLKKIRLLTLMSIAENNNVIHLDKLAEELDLPPDDHLEEFIIDAIQVNAISGKLNEMTRTLVVSSFQHRQFGREQWQTLQKRLQTLVNNLKQSHANIHNINQHIDSLA